MAIIIIASAIVAIIFILIAGVVYSHVQTSRKNAAKQRSLLEESRELQHEFKLQVQFLFDAEIIDRLQKQRFTYLATNFFVFQTINDKNITNLMTMTKYFTDITTKAMNVEMSEQLISVFSQAAAIIPTGATGFTQSFYSVNVAKMILDLNQNVDRLMKGDFDVEDSEDDNSENKDNTGAEDIDNEVESDSAENSSEENISEDNNGEVIEHNEVQN